MSSRIYYERTNYLVQQYLYIDELLDSSLPHDLLNEYNGLPSISEESPVSISASSSNGNLPISATLTSRTASETAGRKVRRTPKDIYRPTETTPLFQHVDEEEDDEVGPSIPRLDDDDTVESNAPIVVSVFSHLYHHYFIRLGLGVTSLCLVTCATDTMLTRHAS